MKHLNVYLLTLTTFSSLAATKAIPSNTDPSFKRQNTFDLSSWIQNEVPIAEYCIFRNIGGGEFARDADPGCVVASPSTESPNYYYQWIRDEALTYKLLFNLYKTGNSTLESYLRNYITESSKLQHTSNPSGDYYSGGLGEPKFNVDGTAYSQPWGRPQRDGPALRATVMIAYANDLLDRGQSAFVSQYLYQPVLPYNSVIKADLEYVSHNWQENSFDLWEEINGRHFFTLMVQRRALLEGAEFADRLGDSAAAEWYRQQAGNIAGVLSTEFWDPTKNFLLASVNVNTGRVGLDCGTLLGSLHGNGKRGFGLYQPDDESVLATTDAMIKSFQPLYTINSNGDPGFAIGRYPEDVYNGAGSSRGNPWFICTFTVAEVLYNALNTYITNGNVTVGSRDVAFFQRFVNTATPGQTYSSGSVEYELVTLGMMRFADSFAAKAGLHANGNGSMSEEFERDSGIMTGARDLTWTYASFLTTALARARKIAY